MRLIRLEHMDLVVADIEKSVDFYRKLGFCPDGTIDGGDTVFLNTHGPGAPIGVELHQAKDGQATGIDHISLEVESVEAAYREAKYLGVKFHVTPQEGTQSGRTIANFYDPDGVHLQFSRKTRRADYEDWG